MSRTPRAWTRSARLAAVPLLVGIVLAWHPQDPREAAELTDMLGRWLTIHIVLLLGVPVLALAVRHLLDGIPGRAAAASRLLLAPAAALYVAFDSLVGIGTGILVAETARLDVADRAGAAALTQVWWEVPPLVGVVAGMAVASWTAALALAAVAARTGHGSLTAWALGLSALLFALGHPGLTGAASMAALAVAIVAATNRTQRGPGGRGSARDLAGAA